MKDIVYGIFAIIEVLMLELTASGLLKTEDTKYA